MYGCDLKVYSYTKYIYYIVVIFKFQLDFKTVIKYILKVIKIYLYDPEISSEIFV